MEEEEEEEMIALKRGLIMVVKLSLVKPPGSQHSQPLLICPSGNLVINYYYYSGHTYTHKYMYTCTEHNEMMEVALRDSGDCECV